MSIYNYSLLEVVVETQNFTRASERLHLTPSAISHAVAKIESELGFPIFDRTREGVTLNENGNRNHAKNDIQLRGEKHS